MPSSLCRYGIMSMSCSAHVLTARRSILDKEDNLNQGIRGYDRLISNHDRLISHHDKIPSYSSHWLQSAQCFDLPLSTSVFCVLSNIHTTIHTLAPRSRCCRFAGFLFHTVYCLSRHARIRIHFRNRPVPQQL